MCQIQAGEHMILYLPDLVVIESLRDSYVLSSSVFLLYSLTMFFSYPMSKASTTLGLVSFG